MVLSGLLRPRIDGLFTSDEGDKIELKGGSADADTHMHWWRSVHERTRVSKKLIAGTEDRNDRRVLWLL